MTGILHALEWINKYIFSPLLPILIFGAGIYFAFSLRFFCITHPVKFLRVFFPKKEKGLKRDKDSISPFKAVTLALAGTLGVGNIIGVSAAIMTGGFWINFLDVVQCHCGNDGKICGNSSCC